MQKSEMAAADLGPGPREEGIPLLSTSGAARLLLAVAAIYIFFTSFFVFWVDVHTWRFFNLYYLFMATVCAVLALYSLRELKPHRGASLGRRRWLRVFAIFGLGLVAWIVYRYPQLFSFSLWLDEVTQFQGSWLPHRPRVDPALFAAAQQQPPIDYYLSAFARNVFGVTEVAARAHTIAFGILAYAVFLMWLVRVRFPLALAPIPIMLFAAHHTLLRFSVEARPISLSVFFALITLIFTHESVQRRKTCVWPLAASTLLLLYSVGLQPMFFLAVLGISLLPLIYRYFERSEAIAFFLTLNVIPLILFSPTVWEIYRRSEAGNQFYSSSYIELWWAALKSISWDGLFIYRHTFQGAQWTFAVPVSVLILAVVFRKLNFKSLPSTTRSWAIAGIIFSLLFPLLFQIFWSIVNWLNQPHYFVLWVVGHLALSSLCVAYLSRSFGAGRRGALIGVGFLLLGGYGVYELQTTYVAEHRHKIEGILGLRPNWHTIMGQARNSKRPVKVMEIPYARLGSLNYHLVSGSFYEHPPKSRMVDLGKLTENRKLPIFDIRNQVDANNQSSDLFYLLAINDDGKVKTQTKKILSTLKANADEILSFSNRFFLFRLNNLGQAAAISKTKHLFESIIAADPEGNNNFYLADALARESIRVRDCKMAQKWLGVMRATHVDPSHPLYKSFQNRLFNVSSSVDHIPSCGGSRIGLLN